MTPSAFLETTGTYSAFACSVRYTWRIRTWFVEFEQFLVVNEVKDCPSQIRNSDEAGFPLCPKNLQSVCYEDRHECIWNNWWLEEQITFLCAANAAGDVLPPMQVFAGERFHYNPMANCIPNAYFGRSTNGWINTELFFGWLANHFGKQVTIQPVVLLVDGHNSHTDLEVAKFGSKNQILLYCLPPSRCSRLMLAILGHSRVLGGRNATNTERRYLVIML